MIQELFDNLQSPRQRKAIDMCLQLGVGHSQSSFCHPLAPEGANAYAPCASSLKYNDSFCPVYFTWLF